MNEKPRVVIDTQVFLRAAISRQSLIGKIIFDLNDRYQIVFSVETKAELADVLSRPKVRAKFVHLTDEVAQTVLAIFDSAEQVVLPASVEAVSRDPKDDIFLACAVVGNAQYLVTEDNDLLVLIKYQDVEIINVPQFFQIIRPPAE